MEYRSGLILGLPLRRGTMNHYIPRVCSQSRRAFYNDPLNRPKQWN
jgi:hypothetical protein